MLLGCQKLGISDVGCKVVLEESGAEIDDDETLQEYDGSVLMILKPDEDWSAASEQETTPKTLYRGTVAHSLSLGQWLLKHNKTSHEIPGPNCSSVGFLRDGHNH